MRPGNQEKTRCNDEEYHAKPPCQRILGMLTIRRTYTTIIFVVSVTNKLNGKSHFRCQSTSRLLTNNALNRERKAVYYPRDHICGAERARLHWLPMCLTLRIPRTSKSVPARQPHTEQ